MSNSSISRVFTVDIKNLIIVSFIGICIDIKDTMAFFRENIIWKQQLCKLNYE